ncbi:MAG: serine hydrolase domain-containing protein [Bacteroidota bacterium]
MKTNILRICLLLSLITSVYAEEKIPEKIDNSRLTNIQKSNTPIDLKRLEERLDLFFKEQMAKDQIQGIVFVMVKDGRIILEKGFGFSDVEMKINIKPAETIFKVGSVSKLLTAIAAMQLYEKNKINLNEDVNKYFTAFKLENNFPKPVTMTDLLSHTAGFRGRSIGSLTRKESERISLEDFITSNMPERALPPGCFISYSNHGYQLAGYLVEVLSGMSFPEYIEKNILVPLGMKRSSFNLKLDMLQYLAKGYSYVEGNYSAVQEDYSLSLVSPAGSLLSTAEDMAHLMIAQLQGGYYNGTRILDESTCREMQRQQFSNDPRLPGTCYGFYEYHDFNQRAIFIDGDVTGFSSRLFLLPDQNTGFFVCNNSGNSRLRMQLTDTLMSYLFPLPEKQNPKESITKTKAPDTRILGSYRNLRIGIEYFDKYEAASALLTLSDDDIRNWIEIESLFFQIPNSKTRLLFRENQNGEITHLFIDSKQMPVSYEKVHWYDSSEFLWYPLGLFFVVFLSASIIMLIRRNKVRKHNLIVENQLKDRQAHLLLIVTVIINLIFIICFIPTVHLFSDELEFGMPFIIKMILVLPILSLILTVGLAAFTFVVWKNKYWHFTQRLSYSLITLICVGFIFWLHHWNWLGFQY